MAWDIFGFEIKRKAKDDKKKLETVVAPLNEDGATVVEGIAGGAGAWGTFVDLDGTIKNEYELVTRYRKMAIMPECDNAIDDIVNDAIVFEDNNPPVAINLDQVDGMGDKVKKAFTEEFDNIYELLNFRDYCYNIFKRWYIDGRLYYNVIIDEKHPAEGIKELRYIDPRQIRKVREVQRKSEGAVGAQVIEIVDEYYIYNAQGLYGRNTETGVKLTLDSIVYAHSGELDDLGSMVVSYLHKAMKCVNQLSMIEDSLVIYRMSRAPERRVFYIDVGTLPNNKAEDYIRRIMNKYKNKMVFDSVTGEVSEDRRHMCMLEDFWLPRRADGNSTQIETLKGGDQLSDLGDVDYFLKKMYKALNVPFSRFNTDTTFNFGRASEITRDELKFSKFINRLRLRFSHLFNLILEKQVLLKQICTQEEWNEWKQQIVYDFQVDSHFAESKETEILTSRINLLKEVEPYIGKYFSNKYIREFVLKQTEDEIKQIDQEIDEEKSQGIIPEEDPELAIGDGETDGFPSKPDGLGDPEDQGTKGKETKEPKEEPSNEKE